MGNVISLHKKETEEPEQNEPTVSGEAMCLECGNIWIRVAPAGTYQFECPKCHTMKGVYKYPCEPDDEMWTCNCGCTLFVMNRKGTICHRCGVYQEIK